METLTSSSLLIYRTLFLCCIFFQLRQFHSVSTVVLPQSVVHFMVLILMLHTVKSSMSSSASLISHSSKRLNRIDDLQYILGALSFSDFNDIVFSLLQFHLNFVSCTSSVSVCDPSSNSLTLLQLTLSNAF
uniref:Putative product n=1 Tax=Xenopsylla cheopis TaxID=163159 RepID=A0A6M2DX18_XENCH